MDGNSRGLLTRHLESVLGELLQDEPVVILTGARTVGKSTLLARVRRAPTALPFWIWTIWNTTRGPGGPRVVRRGGSAHAGVHR